MYHSWPEVFQDNFRSHLFRKSSSGTLEILIDHHGDRFHKYEGCVDLFHRPLEESMTHSDPEDDHLRGEGLMGKRGETYGSVSGVHFTMRHHKSDPTYREDVPNIAKRI
jgi:hypothetical protein